MNTLQQRIEDNSTPVTESGCWLWDGSLARGGYGRLRVKQRHSLYAHRVSYQAFKGEIPKGLCVLHSCDERSCVNPDHLTVGTYAENSKDMVERGRSHHGETHYAAKLTDAQVLEIYNGKLSDRATAALYGISKGPVSAIRRGIKWVHITGGKPCTRTQPTSMTASPTSGACMLKDLFKGSTEQEN